MYQKVREEYDPYDDFPGLDPSSFDYPFEYDFAIDERREWKEEHDPEDKYDVDPGAYEYEDDYVEAIKKWKRHIADLMQNPLHIQVIVIKRRNNCLGNV